MTSRPSEEILRKSLHLPGLFFLFLAYYSRALSICLLAFLIALYFLSWSLQRWKGVGIPLISHLTERLKREVAIDLGPPLLALGILFALLFFDLRSAACGILQVCVADGAASVVGKKWGAEKIFYSPKKSYWGTLAFFVLAFLIQLPLIPWKSSLILSLAGTFLESLPFGAFDNLLIPVGVGLLAFRLL